MRPEALLAIRSDIRNEVEQEYLEWLTREHTLERVGIDGFLSARIFHSGHAGFGRYLILYELADAGVVDSPAYLERLNNPTDWTTRMMPHLGNFVRGGGRMSRRWGAGCGACLVAIMTDAATCTDESPALEAIAAEPGIVAIRILQTDAVRTTAASNERKLRSGDQSFEALLMIEALDTRSARRLEGRLPPTLSEAAMQQSDGVQDRAYSMVFSLDKSAL